MEKWRVNSHSQGGQGNLLGPGIIFDFLSLFKGHIRVLLALWYFEKIAIESIIIQKQNPVQDATIMMKNDDIAGNHHPLNCSTESFYAWKITG
jgi:hypothetical protein